MILTGHSNFKWLLLGKTRTANPKPSPPKGLLINVLVKCDRQGWLRHGSYHSVSLLSSLENHNGRNTSDAVLSRNCWPLICVDLQAPKLASIFLCKLVNYRGNHATWSTPGGPKINQNWNLALQHKRLPCCFSNNPSYCNNQKKKIKTKKNRKLSIPIQDQRIPDSAQALR